jgi:hypothetical protein
VRETVSVIGIVTMTETMTGTATGTASVILSKSACELETVEGHERET